MQENKQEKSLIKKNILYYLDKIGVTPYECYKKTGITRGVLSQNNGITEDNIAKFIAYYDDVNIEWLITGRGKMTISTEETTRNLAVCDDVVNEPEGVFVNTFKLENEKLKEENDELNKKLVKVQETLLELLAKNNGNENLLDGDRLKVDRSKHTRVKGYRGVCDPRVHMLLQKLVHDQNR